MKQFYHHCSTMLSTLRGLWITGLSHLHFVSLQPTDNSIILFIQIHLFRIRISLLPATWMLINNFQHVCWYERSQFSNTNRSASFFALFARCLSSFPPLLPRVTAVVRNKTTWEAMPCFHFLPSVCWNKRNYNHSVFRHCPGWPFAHIMA